MKKEEIHLIGRYLAVLGSFVHKKINARNHQAIQQKNNKFPNVEY